MGRGPEQKQTGSLRGRITSGIVVVLIVTAGWYVVQTLGGRGDVVDATDDSSAAPETSEAGSAVVVLPDGKVEVAGFETEKVERRSLQHMHTVAGRIRYDETRHIEIRSPVDGILIESLVKPGDRVETGQLLAVISSPEIGQARADLLKCESEYALVQRRAERQQQILTNVTRLFAELDGNPTFDAIEKSFTDQPLGSWRDKAIAAWSRLLLARQLAGSARSLAESGSLPGRTLLEREAERQVAQAEFQSIRDQAAFEAKQDSDQAASDLADAVRRVSIARHHLETLLGYAVSELPADPDAPLSQLQVQAPFSGTVERRTFARSERVARTDSLFVLADTSTLYVAADIRENDWPATNLEPGRVITVSSPAIADRTFQAIVYYVGRELDVESNSIPLVATIDNSEGLLRPGMFVRVSVPVGEISESLAVRPEAVVQHDNEQFVFIAQNDHTFERVDIVTGRTTDEWVEVVSGLEAGQRVVDSGAFLLKSELLLKGFEE